MRLGRLLASSLFVIAAASPSSAQPDAWLRDSRAPLDLPHGSRVEFTSMASDAIGGDAEYSVFLPPSYADGNESFPVVYFLHGLFNDHTSWTVDRHGDIPALLDRTMHEGDLPELVMVFPDGGRSFYTNYKDGSKRYEDLIVEEIPAHVESTYRVRSESGSRGIAGTSMGGYGALKIAMRHPDRFAGVAAHSPIVFPLRNPLDVPESARQGRLYQYIHSVFTTVYGQPFDQEYFDRNNPLELARGELPPGLAMYFDYGTADRYNRSVGLGLGLQKLSATLDEKGFDHTFVEHAGEPHGWALVHDHIVEPLRFLTASMD